MTFSRGLGVLAVVAGGDFRFGHGRGGDVDLLKRLGARHGFHVHLIREVGRDGERVSSTRIRAAIRAGDIGGAATLPGRDQTIGIERTPSGWITATDQILPPEGRWNVEICNALGFGLIQTVLTLSHEGETGWRFDMEAPLTGRILRWRGLALSVC